MFFMIMLFFSVASALTRTSLQPISRLFLKPKNKSLFYRNLTTLKDTNSQDLILKTPTEVAVYNTLARSGYKLFPLFYLTESVKDLIVPEELNTLVCGDNKSFTKLKQLCPTHLDRSHGITTDDHVLAVEADLSLQEAVDKIFFLRTSWLDRVILKDPALLFPKFHYVLYLYGNHDTKDWILNGYNSDIQSHRDLWTLLAYAKVSVFHRESYNVNKYMPILEAQEGYDGDWVNEVTKELAKVPTTEGSAQLKTDILALIKSRVEKQQ